MAMHKLISIAKQLGPSKVINMNREACEDIFKKGSKALRNFVAKQENVLERIVKVLEERLASTESPTTEH